MTVESIYVQEALWSVPRVTRGLFGLVVCRPFISESHSGTRYQQLAGVIAETTSVRSPWQRARASG
eukprot:scaffold331871_cov34-Prasinocladus_malaysianus.AAC.1